MKQIGTLKDSVLEYFNHYYTDSEKNGKISCCPPDPALPLDSSTEGISVRSNLIPKYHDKDKMIRNPWQLIDKYKILQAKEETEKSYHETDSRKKRMAMALNDQIKEKENLIKKSKDEYQRCVTAQEEAIKQWEEEKQILRLKEKQKADELKKVRQQQIQERLKLKQVHDAIRKEQESKEIMDIQNALMKEEENKYKSKVQERANWENIIKENAEKLKEQNKRKEEEDRMDAKLMAAMKEKMDMEEAKRIEALQMRSQKLEFNSQLLSEKGAFKKRDEIRKFEQSLLKAAQDRERAQIEEETKRKENIRKRINVIQETNKKMIEDKLKQKVMLEKEKEAYVAQCLKDVEIVTSEEQMKMSKQKENKLRYREILKSQMEDRKQRRAKEESMTPAEWSINKKIIEDAQNFLKERREL